MNTRLLALVAAWGMLGAGCGTLDVTGPQEVARVVTGTVRAERPLPAGTEIVVRVIESGVRLPRSSPDLPVGDRALTAAVATERMLAEHVQTLAAATGEPVPFRLAFEAADETLRRGLNLDARVAIGGRVRFRSIRAHVVTLASAPFPQEVAVQAVE